MLWILALETGNNTGQSSSPIVFVIVGVIAVIALIGMFLKGRGGK